MCSAVCVRTLDFTFDRHYVNGNGNGAMRVRVRGGEQMAEAREQSTLRAEVGEEGLRAEWAVWAVCGL